MPTVAEVLKQSGLTQEQIDAIDAKAISALNGYVTTVEQSAQHAATKAEEDRKAAEAASASAKVAQDAAELQKRSVDEVWQNTYNPGVAAWEAEKAVLAQKAADEAAAAAFYKAQNDALKEQGIILKDAPNFTPPATPPPGTVRNDKGQFVPNVPGSTPGSPTFTLEQIDQRLGNGISNVGWAMQEYQRLTGGQFLPDPFDQLDREATNQKLPFRDYVARKYDFAGKQQAIVQKQQQEHDATVAATERAKADADWKAKLDAREAEFAVKERQHAERAATGSPVSVAVSAKIPELQRRVETKELPDPLLMNENQRRANTAKMIRDQIAESKSQAA